MNAAIYGADGFFTGQFIGGPTAEYIERMTPAGFFAWVYDGPSLDVRRYRVDHGQLVEHIPEAPMETDDLTWIWEPAVWRWVGVPTPAAVFLARRTAMADAVLQEITTAEAQQRMLDILQFKLDVLWSMLDAMTMAYALQRPPYHTVTDKAAWHTTRLV